MRILILPASTGGGHKRAAAAIKEKIEEISPQTTVIVIDALKAIGKVYDRTICDGYHFMATKIPKVYGACYKITDHKSLMYDTVIKTNDVAAKRLLSTIEHCHPDIIISCHPFVTGMLSRLKKKEKISTKVISLITDYDAHRTYIMPNIEAYVLAGKHMKFRMISEYDVDESHIYPLGIPILDKFSLPYDKAELCKKEDLDPNKPTVLLMAGSFGVSTVLNFYKALVEKSRDLQYIVITGNNKHLYKHLKEAVNELDADDCTKLLYFVDNVEDYMHIADLIVTKPGGLTVTESIACKLPLAIYNAVSGQERDNAQFLVNSGVAILLNKYQGADQIITLLNNKERLAEMREICGSIATNNSAEKIFELAKKLYNEDNEENLRL